MQGIFGTRRIEVRAAESGQAVGPSGMPHTRLSVTMVPGYAQISLSANLFRAGTLPVVKWRTHFERSRGIVVIPS